MELSSDIENISQPDLMEWNYTTGEVIEMPIWGFWLKQIATPIIVVIGVVGNLLSMYLMRPRRRGNKSYRQYLFSLAFFDTLTLVERQMSEIDILMVNERDTSLYRYFSDVGCSTFNFASNTATLMSSWLIVLMSFERVVAVYFPLKRSSWCQPKTAIYSILILFILIALSQVFRLVMIEQKEDVCVSKQEYLEIYLKLDLYFYKFSMLFLLPMTLACLLNGMVVYKMCLLPQLIESEHLSSAVWVTRMHRRKNKTSIMLIIVSFTYIVTMCPAAVTSFYIHISLRRYGKSQVNYIRKLMPMFNSFEVISELNYAINFYIYIMSDKSYRVELKRIFRGEKRNSLSVSRTRMEQVTLTTQDGKYCRSTEGAGGTLSRSLTSGV